MTKYDLYWKTNPEWYNYTDDEDEFPQLTEAAPPEARESFARYLEEKKRHKERREALAAELEAQQREKRYQTPPDADFSEPGGIIARSPIYEKSRRCTSRRCRCLAFYVRNEKCTISCGGCQKLHQCDYSTSGREVAQQSVDKPIIIFGPQAGNKFKSVFPAACTSGKHFARRECIFVRHRRTKCAVRSESPSSAKSF